jgi:hypothetical protein
VRPYLGMEGPELGYDQARGDKTGRFSFSDVHTENPRMIATKVVLISGRNSARFKVLCIGELLAALQGDVCFGLIGQGLTFCIRKGCKTCNMGGAFEVNHNTMCYKNK